jgi:hypothetical protein
MEASTLSPWITDSVCPICQSTFRHYKSKRRVTCSTACRIAHHTKAPKMIRCKKCQRRMPEQKYTNGRKRRFCSRWCANNRNH